MKNYTLDLNLKNNLVNLSSSILKRFNVNPNHESMEDLDELLKKNKNKKVILFLFDALGKVIIDSYKDSIPYIYSHRYKEFSSIFPPTTVAATDALLTNKYPYENGFIGWNEYFPSEDKFIDVFLNKDKVKKEIINKNVIKEYLKPVYIDELINKQNKKDIALIIKDIDIKIEDEYLRLETFFNKVDEEIKTHEFIYAYSALPDHTMHNEGIFGENVKLNLLALEKGLKKVVENNKDTLILLIADHGFIDIKNINIREDKELVSCLKRNDALYSVEGRFASMLVKEDKIETFKKIYEERYKDKFYLISKKDLLKKNMLGVGNKFHDLDKMLGNYFLLSYSEFNLTEDKDFDLKGAHAGITLDEMNLYLSIYNND